MEFYIKTLDFLERVMNGVMAIDPGQQPFISQDLEELNEMRNSLLKASGQAERSHEETAALPIRDVNGCWVVSNDERPTEDGVYTTIDSHGIECETLFDNKHWIIRPCGHPVQLWLKPNCR
jgi:hypothetical protein